MRSDGGAEALREAAFRGRLDTVELLIANGVNINARDDNGVSTLHVAHDRGEMEIFNLLLAHGAVDFERREPVAQPAAPAQPTTVIVQQQAPAAASATQPARSVGTQIVDAITPQLQNGTYRMSGRGEQIIFAGIGTSGV